MLGSASSELLKQSSETLAGRIAYLELTPFMVNEINTDNQKDLLNLWQRGGFPDSYLARNDELSLDWRENFIRTYLERYIPQEGFNISSHTLQRLWTMLAHLQGGVVNYSKIGSSLGVSYHTVQKYLEIFEKNFLIRIVQPFYGNIKKRLVKSPKIYLRDSGFTHALLGIDSYESLLGHPAYGGSWEGFAIENILNHYQGYRYSFMRTSNGSEIDLVLERGKRKIAIEIKASSAPSLSQGFWNSLDVLKVDMAFVVGLVTESYLVKENVMVVPLNYSFPV